MTDIDPRIVALEQQFSQLHVQLFDTLSHAQSAVMQAMITGRDIGATSDDYQQLKRDFEVSAAMYKGSESIKVQIKATNELVYRDDISNLHMTQVWAAGVSALSCDRMLQMIPSDLVNDHEITGELIARLKEHLGMWQERLANP